MAISDYIPNVFATSNPMYEGLLGAEDAAALSQRSNVAGLLGAAAALATGMGSQGPRRSALQNVLGALAAGYGTSGQAYQAGIEQMANAQKLAQAKLQMQQNAMAQQAVNQLLKDPAIANDPAAVAYIRSNPTDAIKQYAEMKAFQRQRESFMAPAAPAAPTPTEGAPVTVTGNAEIANLERQINESLADASAYRSMRKPQEAEASVRMAEKLRERQLQVMAGDIDIQDRIAKAPEQFKGQYQAIAQIKESLKPDQLIGAIQKVDQAVLESGKQYKYDGITGQYAYNMFGTNDATKLTPEQNRNILAFANAPTQADQTKIAIDAQRLKVETGTAPALPVSREQMLSGAQPAVQPSTQAAPQVTQAPTVIPRSPIPPMARPPAPKVPDEMQRTGEPTVPTKPTTQKPLVDIGNKIPLIKQPDIKVPLAKKQKLLGEQGGATAATSYALTNIKDARDVAKNLLENSTYIKSLSGPFAPKFTEYPIGPAYDAKQILDNLLGRSFVNEIAEMRANSPTGGAVGNVAVQEMEALSKIRGALKVGMSEKELRNQLQTYINNADRALDSIPKRYAEIYGYDGQFDNILTGTVIPPKTQETDPVKLELQRRKDAAKKGKKP
jgi:hypothetical protein